MKTKIKRIKMSNTDVMMLDDGMVHLTQGFKDLDLTPKTAEEFFEHIDISNKKGWDYAQIAIDKRDWERLKKAIDKAFKVRK